MVRFDIKIGFKEIIAFAVSVPLIYEKLRKIKIKYDQKAKKTSEAATDRGFVFGDIFVDGDGHTWRRER